jgi:hypothetical protein
MRFWSVAVEIENLLKKNTEGAVTNLEKIVTDRTTVEKRGTC